MSHWTDYWLTARRAPGAPLPRYRHGNDSGWDNATTFDPERLAVSVGLAAFLTLQLRELASLATESDHDDEARKWTRLAEATQEAMLGELWTGAFRGLCETHGFTENFDAVSDAESRTSPEPAHVLAVPKMLDREVARRTDCTGDLRTPHLPLPPRSTRQRIHP